MSDVAHSRDCVLPSDGRAEGLVRASELFALAAERDCLIAEVEQNRIDLEEYRRDVERLRAALEAICMMDISWVGDAFKLKDIARAALEET